MIKRFKDSFYADKVLFPTKKSRMLFYGVWVIGWVIIIIAAAIASLEVVERLLLLILGMYLVFIIPSAWWMNRATRYIVDRRP